MYLQVSEIELRVRPTSRNVSPLDFAREAVRAQFKSAQRRPNCDPSIQWKPESIPILQTLNLAFWLLS
jgi:hypothetical protein